MKTIIKKYPVTYKFVLAILLFALALIISLVVNKGVIKQYVPYTASILLVLVTWILYKTQKQSLNEIGFNFRLRNLSFLPLGILIGAFAFFGARYLRALYTGETLELSNSIDYSNIIFAFYFILPQVATEELLFRGYLFKKTIDVSNVIIANILFSTLFMLIHVLDTDVLSNTGMIIMLVMAIPVGHLLFATALLKSKTIYFPIGLHLGNNWATRHLINNYEFGNSIFYIPNTVMFETWSPFITVIFLFNGFFLLVTFLIWKWDRIISILR
ncbi:CPBP family intramembrane glutamic endopeptidase [Ichthyenterobacterium sp. W332]|uniref:CPBP family intramembrane glutamic endopeptidase n=1 Tax=Microcosmobacter mediterraneus TaxID=3075607 RepID=A0ABU2YP15_9FLAO|nr:CPBP family intramembrane glutamic endopeptidase [Ichthyenterobacterium sp. W332]MDT0559631.1 CPBP family intramembrane glutamic endopeptidase [Ichthyenterobacterium sp. W332]